MFSGGDVDQKLFMPLFVANRSGHCSTPIIESAKLFQEFQAAAITGSGPKTVEQVDGNEGRWAGYSRSYRDGEGKWKTVQIGRYARRDGFFNYAVKLFGDHSDLIRYTLNTACEITRGVVSGKKATFHTEAAPVFGFDEQLAGALSVVTGRNIPVFTPDMWSSRVHR